MQHLSSMFHTVSLNLSPSIVPTTSPTQIITIDQPQTEQTPPNHSTAWFHWWSLCRQMGWRDRTILSPPPSLLPSILCHWLRQIIITGINAVFLMVIKNLKHTHLFWILSKRLWRVTRALKSRFYWWGNPSRILSTMPYIVWGISRQHVLLGSIHAQLTNLGSQYWWDECMHTIREYLMSRHAHESYSLVYCHLAT